MGKLSAVLMAASLPEAHTAILKRHKNAANIPTFGSINNYCHTSLQMNITNAKPFPAPAPAGQGFDVLKHIIGDLGIAGLPHHDKMDCPSCYSLMMNLSRFSDLTVPGYFGFPGLRLFSPSISFRAVIFSGRHPHHGTPPYAPNPLPWETRLTLICYPSAAIFDGDYRASISSSNPSPPAPRGGENQDAAVTMVKKQTNAPSITQLPYFIADHVHQKDPNAFLSADQATFFKDGLVALGGVEPSMVHNVRSLLLDFSLRLQQLPASLQVGVDFNRLLSSVTYDDGAGARTSVPGWSDHPGLNGYEEAGRNFRSLREQQARFIPYPYGVGTWGVAEANQIKKGAQALLMGSGKGKQVARSQKGQSMYTHPITPMSL
jgi:hypothetical protein